MVKTKEQKEIESLRRELKEEHGWRMSLHQEVKELKDSNKRFEGTRLTLYEACIQEREELISRVRKIDMRIRCLGFLAPDDKQEQR